MTTGIIITIVLAVIAYIAQAVVGYHTNKAATTKAITDLEKNLSKHITGINATLTTDIAVVVTKIGYLETKQDKHNSLIERMVKAEQSTASAHHRLDDVCEEIRRAK